MASGHSAPQQIDLSIVTTLYLSSSYIREFHARISAEAAKVSGSYEIVFVNDGSPDDSLAVALEIARRDPLVTVVDLSRNFGHHNAIMAGLAHARGGMVFLLDVDLEEEPELLSRFLAEFRAGEAEVVYGVQVERKGGWFRGNFVGLFYTLFNVLSETKIPCNVCTVRLMSREYVDALLRLHESNIFLAGAFSWIGFRQKSLMITKKRRQERSSYSLVRMLRLLMNAIIGFSSYPLILAFVVGLIISGISAAAGLIIIVRKLLYGNVILVGWPSVMVTIWFLGGLTIFFIGLVGLYLSKTYIETKRRPPYIIRKVYERGADE